MPKSYQRHAKIMPKPCQHHADIMSNSCQHHANIMPKPCQHHTQIIHIFRAISISFRFRLELFLRSLEYVEAGRSGWQWKSRHNLRVVHCPLIYLDFTCLDPRLFHAVLCEGGGAKCGCGGAGAWIPGLVFAPRDSTTNYNFMTS